MLPCFLCLEGWVATKSVWWLCPLIGLAEAILRSLSLTLHWQGRGICTSFITWMDDGMDVPYIAAGDLMLVSLSSPITSSIYRWVSHCSNSSGCPFEVLAEQSRGVLTHLESSPAWNLEHDACVSQSINTSALHIHVFCFIMTGLICERCWFYKLRGIIRNFCKKKDYQRKRPIGQITLHPQFPNYPSQHFTVFYVTISLTL